MKKRIAFCVVLLLVLQQAWAQTGSQGSIHGTVTDQTQAVVSGAQITVTNVATGLTRQATSNVLGEYRIDQLPAGEYRIEVRKDGFQTAEVSSTRLRVGQDLRIDTPLTVGSVADVVTVTAEAVQLNTTTSSQGAVIENNEISKLPLNGREFLSLASLVPGAYTGTRFHDNPVPAKGDIVVGFSGARGTHNAYYLDGGQNTSPYYNNMVSSPSVDAIQEFRIETNHYSARYGQSGGGVVNVITKSGTNSFHGSLYEYHRNKAMDAQPYFHRGTKEELPNQLWNQFGGTIGGPIRRDKVFFFANAEFFRHRTSELKIGFAPTAAERVGDVRNSINPWSGLPVELTHPFTGDVIPSGILPEELKTPVGQALMNLWPEPNFPENPAFNLRLFRPKRNDVNKYLGRIDVNLSDQDSLSGTFNYGNYDSGVPGFIDEGDKILSQHDRTVTTRYTRSFSSNLVSSTGFTYSHYFFGDRFRIAKNQAVELGMDTSVNQNDGMPWLLLFTQGSQFFTFGAAGDNKNVTKQGQIYHDVSWQKGRHTIQFGGMFWRQNYNWQFFSGSSQYFVNLLDGLPGTWPLFGVTGSSFTNLLSGLYNLGVFGGGDGSYTRFQRNTYGLYVQDSWRLNPGLTLNFGVRWDYERPFRSLDSKYLSLDDETGLIRYASGAPGIEAMQIPFLTDGPVHAYKSHPLTFAPRLGFAWQPFAGRPTVLRGGYGVFHTSEAGFVMQPSSFAHPFGGPTAVWQKGILGGWGADQLRPLSEPPFGVDHVRANSPGCCFIFMDQEFPRTYMQQWNLTFGHDFGKNVIGEIGYVGNRGVNISGYVPLDAYSPEVFDRFVANYGPAVLPPFRTKGFSSTYHALQTSARRNIGRGLTFLAAYTWSHAIADASNDTVTENFRQLADVIAGTKYERFKANAGFDVRHRFSISSVYELPFGRQRSFGSTWNGITQVVLGGWDVNAIYTAQSGFPWSVRSAAGPAPNRICDGNLPKSERTLERWFDHTCFPTHLDGGVPAAGNARPNIIRGPGLNNWDLGIHKIFTLAEGKTLQFRLETFNTWNNPQFLGPPTTNWFTNTAEAAGIANARDSRSMQVALRFAF